MLDATIDEVNLFHSFLDGAHGRGDFRDHPSRDNPLVNQPLIILADEPTANLDSKSAENLLDIMAKLNKENNITFIFSTHDQRVIDKAHRVITLADGKIVSDVKL